MHFDRFFDAIDHWATGTPDAEATWFWGEVLTYAEVARRVDEFARALVGSGVGKGLTLSKELEESFKEEYLRRPEGDRRSGYGVEEGAFDGYSFNLSAVNFLAGIGLTAEQWKARAEMLKDLRAQVGG